MTRKVILNNAGKILNDIRRNISISKQLEKVTLEDNSLLKDVLIFNNITDYNNNVKLLGSEDTITTDTKNVSEVQKIALEGFLDIFKKTSKKTSKNDIDIKDIKIDKNDVSLIAVVNCKNLLDNIFNVKIDISNNTDELFKYVAMHEEIVNANQHLLNTSEIFSFENLISKTEMKVGFNFKDAHPFLNGNSIDSVFDSRQKEVEKIFKTLKLKILNHTYTIMGTCNELSSVNIPVICHHVTVKINDIFICIPFITSTKINTKKHNIKETVFTIDSQKTMENLENRFFVMKYHNFFSEGYDYIEPFLTYVKDNTLIGDMSSLKELNNFEESVYMKKRTSNQLYGGVFDFYTDWLIYENVEENHPDLKNSEEMVKLIFQNMMNIFYDLEQNHYGTLNIVPLV